MTSFLPFLQRLSRLTRKPWSRMIGILLATVLLHLLIFSWGRTQLGARAPGESDADTRVISVALQKTPAPVTPPVPVVVKPPPKPRMKPPPPPAQVQARQPPMPQYPADPADAPAIINSSNGDRQTTNASGSSTDKGASTATSTATIAPPDMLPVAATQPPGSAPPPSVTLKYDVQGLRDGQKVYGSGEIIWRNAGDHYRVDGSASVLFFTLLQFSSDGVLDGFGVSPALYTEKRFHKTATETLFEHARNTITFSSSDNHYPRPGDAQDRASIIWQLAAMGRGNPEVFNAGASFSFFVAGVRDAEPWTLTVLGQDAIDPDRSERGQAWHVVRVPQPGSYDQKIDIWLAPQQQWYPVRIRYTESNGDYLDMSLSGQTPS